jgi:hypothetical protein
VEVKEGREEEVEKEEKGAERVEEVEQEAKGAEREEKEATDNRSR